MRILAIHRFYWPDTPPYASILRVIAKRWVEDGHSVDILSSQPSYKANVNNQKCANKEFLDGAYVMRMRLPNESGRPLARIINVFILGVRIMWQGVVRSRYDVIMISTYPPVLGGVFAALTAKLTGARFIYHCMDIHPEIGRISGEFRNRFIFSMLSMLDKWTCKIADPVVVLSNDMKESLSERDVKNKLNCKVLNNFSLPEEVSMPLELPFSWPKDKFVILFAGNIGRFQGLDVLIEAMGHLKLREDIHLLIMGDGNERPRIEKLAATIAPRVTFVGHHSLEIAKLAMKNAQVGFVSLSPQIYRYAYPSKTMTYLEQGCPIIVVVEQTSCLAKDIIRNHAGVSVPPNDYKLLAEAIVRLTDDPKTLRDMRNFALEFSSKVFDIEKTLDYWSAILKVNEN